MPLSDTAKGRLLLAGVFVAMVAGMVGKTYYDQLTKGSAPNVNSFLIPVLISPMIFGVIFSAVKSTDPIPALILAFQNGFFWQDIFGGLRPVGG